MGKATRRQFLGDLAAVLEPPVTPPASLSEDTIFQRYANKKLPQAKTTGTLNPYVGPWTQAEAMHLLRRTTFGLTQGDVQTLAGMTMSAAVDHLLNNLPATPAPPVNNYTTATYSDPTGVAAGQPWVTAAYGDGTVNAKRRASLKSWWLGLQLNQNLSIQEKMVLFWHNHFATETATIGDARYCYQYAALLRQHALGNFKTFVREMTVNTGMLRYLNGYLNTKNAPDENYARELQELFTVGKGNNPNYTEADVQAAAKVLTGWRIDAANLSSYFDPTKHDITSKQFSAFYGNTVIAGQSGAAGANETDALITMIFAKTETARYICTKLYRYFIYYSFDAATQNTVINQLAATFIASNWNIKPVLSQLLKSDHFFEAASRGCAIRTPLEHLVGTFRSFGISMPANFTVEKTYAVWNYLRGYGDLLAQDLGDPPNVAGWPAWYQTPEFSETWINSNTLPKRLAFTDLMLTTGFAAGTGTAIKIDVLQFTQSVPNADDPDLLVDFCCSLFLGLSVSATTKNAFKSILLSGQSTNGYWTAAWQQYLAVPNAANTAIVKPRLQSLYTTITRMPEHQLS